tara:strand:+ start:5190 stop:5528 length:339 start_codon:yes stop_codon:yes gene_type:complete
MTKKYFPNNWTRLAKVPYQYYDSLPFEDFMDWKANGWEILPSHECIIRTVNCKTGKIAEYVYQRKSAAKKKLAKLLATKDTEIIVCTHEDIHHSKPSKYITEHDKENYYPEY